LGKALAATKRPLVYGGGQNGLMGLVAGAVLDNGGDVTGVVPYAFVASGGEGDKTKKSGAFEGGARVMAQRQSESVGRNRLSVRRDAERTAGPHNRGELYA
jgi:hypothetical protein